MDAGPVRHRHRTDVEGGAPVHVRYALDGQLDIADYLAFTLERATWLGIAGSVRAVEGGRVIVEAAGPEAMVGAFEMALTLGPLTALVTEVSVTPLQTPWPDGFRVF